MIIHWFYGRSTSEWFFYCVYLKAGISTYLPWFHGVAYANDQSVICELSKSSNEVCNGKMSCQLVWINALWSLYPLERIQRIRSHAFRPHPVRHKTLNHYGRYNTSQGVLDCRKSFRTEMVTAILTVENAAWTPNGMWTVMRHAKLIVRYCQKDGWLTIRPRSSVTPNNRGELAHCRLA